MVMGLMVAKTRFIRMLPHGADQATFYLVDKTLKFAVFLSASWIMVKLEVKTISDYGLPWKTMFGRARKSLRCASSLKRSMPRAWQVAATNFATLRGQSKLAFQKKYHLAMRPITLSKVAAKRNFSVAVLYFGSLKRP